MFTLNLSQEFYSLAVLSSYNYSSTAPLHSVPLWCFFQISLANCKTPNPINKSTNETAKVIWLWTSLTMCVLTPFQNGKALSMKDSQKCAYNEKKLRLFHIKNDATWSRKMKANMSGRFPPPWGRSCLNPKAKYCELWMFLEILYRWNESRLWDGNILSLLSTGRLRIPTQGRVEGGGGDEVSSGVKCTPV